MTLAGGVLVFARLDSVRFPRKAFAPLLGVPLVEVVIRRCQAADVGSVVLATTTRPVDDPLADFAASRGVLCLRGDTENVVKRTLDAVAELQWDYFARVNGDSPLVDVGLLRWGRDAIQRGDTDLATNLVERSYPYGVSVEWVRVEPYRELAADATPAELEHVTLHLYRLSNRLSCVAPPRLVPACSDLRLTVDEPADLARIAKLIESTGQGPLGVRYDDLTAAAGERSNTSPETLS